jgi:putative Mg2+ transporter-C (MgtC) family protein
MATTIDWTEIGIRLILTIIAGSLIGINRTERGRPAGLRTTILVCLAASVSMIQVNLLIATTGKTPDSFAVFDLMRLPLGVLTGMGFIGAGAILKRGDMVQGVTTAATLWIVTFIGLCLGGGQIGLGLACLGLALSALWGLKWFENTLHQDRHATLIIRTAGEEPTEEAIRNILLSAGYQIGSWDVLYKVHESAYRRNLRCEVRWHGKPDETRTPEFLDQLKRKSGIVAVRWCE